MKAHLRVAFALLLCAPAVRADSIADEADFRFHRAANLYRQGQGEEALGEFLASDRLVRNRNVIFNIARCFEQLSKFNEAYRWYNEIWNDDMPEGDRRDLQEALKRLRPSLALLQVESEPPGATVYVERKDLGARGQTPVTMALPPGKVTAIVELPGFRPFQQSLTLAIGRTHRSSPRSTASTAPWRLRASRPDSRCTSTRGRPSRSSREKRRSSPAATSSPSSRRGTPASSWRSRSRPTGSRR